MGKVDGTRNNSSAPSDMSGSCLNPSFACHSFCTRHFLSSMVPQRDMLPQWDMLPQRDSRLASHRQQHGQCPPPGTICCTATASLSRFSRLAAAAPSTRHYLPCAQCIITACAQCIITACPHRSSSQQADRAMLSSDSREQRMTA